MKKIIIAVLSAVIFTSASLGADSPKSNLKKVVYATSLECENCAKKIRENISFEKGVKDLKVDVQTKKVEIQFDANKTDTLQLKKAITKLGYEAKVVEYMQ